MASTKSQLLFLSLIYSAILFTFSTSSPSTLAISKDSNQTVICALIPTTNKISFISCNSFPANQTLNLMMNISFSAIAAGDGFLCALRSPPLPSSLLCWNFSEPLLDQYSSPTFQPKLISRDLTLVDLKAGGSQICGISDSGQLHCWRWRRNKPRVTQNLTSLAVGNDFLCGLSDSGSVECYGNSNVVNYKPTGEMRLVAAGFRHACGVYKNGSLVCWGDPNSPVSRELPENLSGFDALALGLDRSCGWNALDQRVRCWGDNFRLPEPLTNAHFLTIEGKGNTFCGIIVQNYSVVCWGNDDLKTPTLIFPRVLPGPCAETCPLDYNLLPGSDQFCQIGSVCTQRDPGSQAATAETPAAPTPVPATSPGNCETNKRFVAFLVVGSIGTFIGIITVSSVLYFRFCKGASCRVHDSGRLDEESPGQAANSHQTPQAQAVPLPLPPPPPPTLDKRLSALFSLSRLGKLEEFPLHVLARITDDFSDDHKIGFGSFGSVYQATLDDGRKVAIKRAVFSSNPNNAKHQDNEHAFRSELAFLSRVNHKNLVQLLGFCEDGNERVLVYEYMINGTLHDHLHKLPISPLMSWIARLKVALDTARGIEYLHKYAVPPIIHRDIKSSNILLDVTWTAKVSDFGLSLLGPEEDVSHLSLKAAGTVGYMDPAYYRLQQLTTKSDVYSFGVVLLELLSGYKAIHRDIHNGGPRNIVDFVVPYISNDEIHQVLDPKVPPPTPSEIEAVMFVGYLAADCVSLDGQDRPSMTEIVTGLERALAACTQPLSRSTSRSTV